MKEKLINFFKKPTATDLKILARRVRSRARLRQQAYDYQEFVRRNHEQQAKQDNNKSHL
jgi:hypothetical protein